MDYLVLFIVLALIYFIAFQPKEKFVDELLDNVRRSQDYATDMFKTTFKF
uniref:Uncharacterized protein n=1 Tax=viral metagenome TaxID=1070528 RepID=A0A6C0DUV0_9ZZZZ